MPQPLPSLTAEQFNAALKEAGFGVERARIIDVSGRCPGFVTTPAFRGRALDRPRTLAKVTRERDAEIRQRWVRRRRPASLLSPNHLRKQPRRSNSNSRSLKTAVKVKCRPTERAITVGIAAAAFAAVSSMRSPKPSRRRGRAQAALRPHVGQ